MGQASGFQISPVTPVTGNQEPGVSATSADARESTRQVAAAVRYLNSVDYAGQGREITFSVDRATRLPVVKVIDAQSREVLQQWPRDSVLQVAEAQLRQKGITG